MTNPKTQLINPLTITAIAAELAGDCASIALPAWMAEQPGTVAAAIASTSSLATVRALLKVAGRSLPFYVEQHHLDAARAQLADLEALLPMHAASALVPTNGYACLVHVVTQAALEIETRHQQPEQIRRVAA